MATIVWEELKQEGIGWVARRNVYRVAKSPEAGWCGFKARIPTFITFLPDPEHRWV